MPLKIDQDFNYQGDDWWKWRIWIEGSETELDQLTHVVYTLHPTFPDPVRTVKDRRSKFLLSASGWGTFRICAKVFSKSGPPLPLQHELILEYPDGAAAKS